MLKTNSNYFFFREKFKSIIEKYKDNINQPIFVDEETETKMNILHVMSAHNCSADYEILYKFVNSLDLLDHKFDVNYRASVEGVYNLTAAHIALQWCNWSMLRVLVDFDADLFICDCNGQNIQDYALLSNNETIIQFINNAIYSSIKNGSFGNYSSNDSSITDFKQYLSNSNRKSSLDSTNSSFEFISNQKLIATEFSEKNLSNQSDTSLNLLNESLSSLTINDDKNQQSPEKNSFYQISKINSDYDLKVDEIVYHDDDLDLFEKRYQSITPPLSINLNNSLSTSLNDSNESAKSIDQFILEISENKHKKEFDEDKDEMKNKMANYNIEFESIYSQTFPFEEAQRCENLLMKQFQNEYDDSKKQTYFVYLLLDPTITKNIPEYINMMMDGCSKNSFASIFGGILNNQSYFYQFITSIFYVGKGQANRPYQHFIDAHREKKQMDNNSKPITAKTKRIWSIWEQGLGPIFVTFFTGISDDEAFTREALIIETISLYNLTNRIYGTYRCKMNLNRRQKSLLGTYLLFKFFITYLLNGERQIKIPNY